MGRFEHSQRFGFLRGLRSVPMWATGAVITSCSVALLHRATSHVSSVLVAANPS